MSTVLWRDADGTSGQQGRQESSRDAKRAKVQRFLGNDFIADLHAFNRPNASCGNLILSE